MQSWSVPSMQLPDLTAHPVAESPQALCRDWGGRVSAGHRAKQPRLPKLKKVRPEGEGGSSDGRRIANCHR